MRTRHTTSKCYVTLGVTLLLAALAPAPGAFATSAYTITDFGAGSSAYDINESGQVVGRNGPIATFGSNAFLYSNGMMLDLGARGGNFGSTAYGLNNLGQVVGFYYDPTDDDNSHPFFYDGTTMHDISGSPSFGEANGINDNGQVVGGIDFDFSAGASPFLYNTNTGTLNILPGIPPAVNSAPVINQHGLNVVNWSDNPADKLRATLFNGLTEIRELGLIPGGWTVVSDINNQGHFLGSGETVEGLNHAFLDNGTSVLDLTTLSGGRIQPAGAIGMNDLDQVVGRLDSEFRAFIFDGATVQDLNDLLAPGSGWVLTSAVDINNQGQIIGQGLFNGVERGFLMTPVPVPAAVYLFGTGLVGLAGLARRRMRGTA